MTGLVKRGSIYYVRLRIPADLAGIFDGRREICKSLKTFLHSEAKSECIIVMDKAKNLFGMMRSGMLTETRMRAMAAAFVREQLHEFEASRFGIGGTVDKEMAEWSNLPVSVLERMVGAFETDLANRKDYRLSGLIAEFVAENHLPIHQGSPEYNRLSHIVTAAFVQFVKTEIERRRGNYANDFDTLLPEIAGGHEKASGRQSEEQKGMSISEVIRNYISEKTSAGRWDVKTAQQNESSLHLMLEILGDRSVTDVTHHDMLGVRDTIQRLPPNRAKSPIYRGKGIDVVLRLKGVKPMTTHTCNNILARLASFWNWAQTHEYVDRTPAHDLLVPTSKRADEERDIYPPDEMQKLVNAVAKYGNSKSRPERVWVTLIAMYSGMRPTEIAQMHIDDIVAKDGVTCFRIADEHDDQKVKNRNARRLVPLHPFLIECGFLKYLVTVSDSRNGLLFPRLRQHRDGLFTYMGRWFHQLNRDHVTSDRKKVFYSLRHGFVTFLKQAKVPIDIIAEIVGHATEGETGSRYGKRYNPPAMLETIKQVDYGLDMSAIRDAARRTYES